MNSKHLVLATIILLSGKLIAQNKDFYGNDLNSNVCAIKPETTNDKEATAALNKICNAADIPNNFTLMPCAEIGNCFALYKDGISYIVYDPKFFKRIQTFGFTEKNLPSGTDWAALTILAHELAHHLCQHTTNTTLTSKYTPVQLELQADEFAGSMMYKLGASLTQAQKAMYTDGVSENESLTHPARKDRLELLAKGYNKYANAKGNNSAPTTDMPSDGRITIVIPQFQITASNVKSDLAEQMKQILVSNMVNEGAYNIVASSYDLRNFRNDPALAYGGEQAIRKANYILLGKIVLFEEKDNSFGIGALKASLGKTQRYGFSFEVINAKTNEMVLIKNWDIKVKTGNMGVSTAVTNLNGNMNVNADVTGTFEKNLKPVIKSILEQKSKIVLN